MGCGLSTPTEVEKVYGRPGEYRPIAFEILRPRDTSLPGTAGQFREGDIPGISHIRRMSTLENRLATEAPMPSARMKPTRKNKKPYPKPFENTEGYFPNVPGISRSEYPSTQHDYQATQKKHTGEVSYTRTITNEKQEVLGLGFHPRPYDRTHVRAAEGFAPKGMPRDEARKLPVDRLEFRAYLPNGGKDYIWKPAKDRFEPPPQRRGR